MIGLPALDPPVLVFDGGCPFCRHFAELAELRSGIPNLAIRDGRSDHELRQQLRQQGWDLSRGAVVLAEGRVLHGAEAIQWICSRLEPSAPLLQLLGLFGTSPVAIRRRLTQPGNPGFVETPNSKRNGNAH